MDIDPIWIVAITCICCAGGIVVLAIFSIVGGLLDIVTGGVDIIMGVLGFIIPFDGGCGCGCITVFFLLGICAVVTVTIVSIASTCGTPDAMNFCRLF